jgi:hypothetical protein
LPTYAALAEELWVSRAAHATAAATIERLSRQFSAFQHLAPGTPPSPAAPLLAPVLLVLEAPALYQGRLVPDEAAAANPTLGEYRPKSMYAPKPFFGRFTDRAEPKDEDNVLRLVKDFEYFAVAHQAPPNFWVYLLRPHLAGSARDWYDNHWYPWLERSRGRSSPRHSSPNSTILLVLKNTERVRVSCQRQFVQSGMETHTGRWSLQ